MTSPPTTFLFTDLENSTDLWEQYPDAMRPALAQHDELLKNAVESNNGRIVKTTGQAHLYLLTHWREVLEALIS